MIETQLQLFKAKLGLISKADASFQIQHFPFSFELPVRHPFEPDLPAT